MFEDDDLDDLDLGLDPPPDPLLLHHFPGSPIAARPFPLVDSTSQVFNDGNRPILTSTQRSHETMKKPSGLSNPQNPRPLGRQAPKKSSGPQTSTQKEQGGPGDASNSQTSLASQALSIIPKATAAEKQHGSDATPDSPSYSPKSLGEPNSPVDSQQLSPGYSPNSATNFRSEPHQQLSPSYSPRSPFSDHGGIGTAEGGRNMEDNSTHTGQMPSSVNKNLSSTNPVNLALSARLPSPHAVTPDSLGEVSADRSALDQRGVQQPKPTELERSLRRCSVLSETGFSPNSPPLEPSPPPRGTKRRFPGPAGFTFYI